MQKIHYPSKKGSFINKEGREGVENVEEKAFALVKREVGVDEEVALFEL
jgi:hypothetical protein